MFPSTATELETNSELNENCYAILALHFPRRRYSKGDPGYGTGVPFWALNFSG